MEERGEDSVPERVRLSSKLCEVGDRPEGKSGEREWLC